MVANAKGAPAPMSSMDSSALVGMKEICAFMHRSEPTITKLIETYRDTIPIKKIAGVWESDKLELERWRREVLLAPAVPAPAPAKPRTKETGKGQKKGLGVVAEEADEEAQGKEQESQP